MNAAAVLNPLRTRYTPALPVGDLLAEHPDDYAGALSWTAREHPVLLATVADAAVTGFLRHAWHLARELETYQMRTGHWTEMTAVQRTALRCAQELGDVLMQAEAHHALAKALDLLGEHESAYAEAAAANTGYRAGGHGRGEANALGSMGDAAAALKQFEKAIHHYEASTARHLELGNLGEIAAYRNNLALVLIETGDLDRANELCQEGLAGFALVRDEHGVAHAQETLGLIHLRQGRPEAAPPALRAAATSFLELGVTYSAAESFAYLGDAHAATGDTADALDAWRRADDLLAGLTAPDAVALRERVSGLVVAVGYHAASRSSGGS